MRQLYVYMNDCKAGVLTEEAPGRGYTFVYDDSYLASDQPSISVTMPKSQKEYKSEHLFPLFTNMLPEGANRRVVCRFHRIDENDFFGLLVAMADKDTIGAMNVKTIHNNKEDDENR